MRSQFRRPAISRLVKPVLDAGRLCALSCLLAASTAQAQLPPELPPEHKPPPESSPVPPAYEPGGEKGGSVKGGRPMAQPTSLRDSVVHYPEHIPPRLRRAKIEAWRKQLEEYDKSLRKERFRKVGKALPGFIDEVLGFGAGEDEAREILGLALTFQALTDADKGLWGRAEWRWHTALHMQPDLAEWNLSIYGKHGRWLGSRGLRPEGASGKTDSPAGTPVLTPPYVGADGTDSSFVAPRLAGELPAPPRFVAADSPWRKITAPETLEVEVSPWGELSGPRLPAGDLVHPVMVYFVLESLWQAQPVTPATLDGEARAVLWQLELKGPMPWLDRSSSRW